MNFDPLTNLPQMMTISMSQAENLLSLAKISLADREPSVATDILSTRIVVLTDDGDKSPSVYTSSACTDGDKIYISLPFLAELTPAQLQGVILHEMSHIWLDHPSRFASLTQKELLFANFAADILINTKLRKLGYELPPSALGVETLQRMGITLPKPVEDYTLEELIKELLKQNPDIEASGFRPDVQSPPVGDSPNSPSQGNAAVTDGRGESQSQSREGDSPSEDKSQSPLPNARSESQSQSQEGDSPSQDNTGDKSQSPLTPFEASSLPTVEASLPNARGWPLPDGRGESNGEESVLEKIAREFSRRKDFSILKASEGILRELASICEKPKIDWLGLFLRFLKSSNRTIYSSLPSRRYLTGIQCFYSPRCVRSQEHLRVFFIIDTSGSMSEEELSRGMNTLLDLAQTFELEVDFISADDEVRAHVQIRPNQRKQKADLLNLPLKGGGGTDFCPALRMAYSLYTPLSVTLFVTDGYGRFPDEGEFSRSFISSLFWLVPETENQTHIPDFPYGKVLTLRRS